ncbi:unnamed protein product [Prorocentrum cordatum]|uniref:Uncharacterized protein n=1 Tax=Prorocentrum cordatum TaxID=2364126 RepID=A0ABN9WUH8_9DINO|nr:unnamed protein product [Polarella glacialis]
MVSSGRAPIPCRCAPASRPRRSDGGGRAAGPEQGRGADTGRSGRGGHQAAAERARPGVGRASTIVSSDYDSRAGSYSQVASSRTHGTGGGRRSTLGGSRRYTTSSFATNTLDGSRRYTRSSYGDSPYSDDGGHGRRHTRSSSALGSDPGRRRYTARTSLTESVWTDDSRGYGRPGPRRSTRGSSFYNYSDGYDSWSDRAHDIPRDHAGRSAASSRSWTGSSRSTSRSQGAAAVLERREWAQRGAAGPPAAGSARSRGTGSARKSAQSRGTDSARSAKEKAQRGVVQAHRSAAAKRASASSSSSSSSSSSDSSSSSSDSDSDSSSSSSSDSKPSKPAARPAAKPAAKPADGSAA